MYKDDEKRKEAQRERIRRYRDKQKGVTSEGVTPDKPEGVTLEETVPTSYVLGRKGAYPSLPERPRFLTLSDGQVLDRANQPICRRTTTAETLRLMAANDARHTMSPYKKK